MQKTQTKYDQFFSIQKKLFRFAVFLADNREEAKDLYQETMLKLWEKRADWEKLENMEAYAIRATKNTFLNWKNKVQRMRVLSTEEVPENLYQSQLPEIESKINIWDLKVKFDVMTRGLSDLQKQIIFLREVEGYEYNEIAELMSVSLSQVKINLFRARNVIKERVAKIKRYER
jgi:RNA polymerase sigma-70 factor (ECF subfamily)